MSTCIKDLYDYDLFKKCSKCGIISLKINFHKVRKKNDGLFQHCKPCRKVCRKKIIMNILIQRIIDVGILDSKL